MECKDLGESLKGELDSKSDRQIYDYINYNYIHNETYAYRLPPSFLQQAQFWADYHEHIVFTDPSMDGIGNGRAIFCLCSLSNSSI